MNKSMCLSCPLDSASARGSDNSTDCKCNAGYTGPDGSTCAACAAGKYKAVNGSDVCTSCPSESTSPPSSDNVTDCTCNVGYTGPDGRTCAACEAGKYKAVVGPEVCTPCPAHSTSASGSKNVTDCKCIAGFPWSDGHACNLAAWDCASSEQLQAPIQYMKCGTAHGRSSCHDSSTPSGHGFYQLDVTTGTYVSLFTISDSEVTLLDACGLSPIDGYAYCTALVSASSHSESRVRLIRFSSYQFDPTNAYFEYVGIMPVPWECDPYNSAQVGSVCLGSAASFAPNGDFFYAMSWSCDPLYCAVDGFDSEGDLYGGIRPDGLPGFPPGQYDNAGLKDFQYDYEFSYHNYPWPYPMSGLAVFVQGSFNFIVALEKSTASKPNPDIFVFRDDGEFKLYSSYIQEGSRALPQAESEWGSMWVFDNRVLVAHDGGAGVYQINTSGLDINDAGVSALGIEYMGPAEAANATDGLNCLSGRHPYNCPAGFEPASRGGCTACEPGKYKVINGSGWCTLLPWNCSSATLARPMRVIQCGTSGHSSGGQSCPNASIASGFGFYALDVYSGSYHGLFSIPAAGSWGLFSQVCRATCTKFEALVCLAPP